VLLGVTLFEEPEDGVSEGVADAVIVDVRVTVSEEVLVAVAVFVFEGVL
jgi:hypothetical protein